MKKFYDSKDDWFCRHFRKLTLFWRMSSHALLVLVIRAEKSYTSYFQKSSQVSFHRRNRDVLSVRVASRKYIWWYVAWHEDLDRQFAILILSFSIDLKSSVKNGRWSCDTHKLWKLQGGNNWWCMQQPWQFWVEAGKLTYMNPDRYWEDRLPQLIIPHGGK